ncbi:elongation factor P maturation arginine rhamnosyltransferase EarP [Shewanella gelidii]|uniref:Protein-arginine rhamnosyltransferase n=1 Tax=Shewanella gelidii TaxID=1642821 RepID=A0A917JWJ3_9GAMM|nr:elongation factor P maturation arginine rhamnosyltransferase EarP [Shewanella gelidii]MCL1099050.1 elongation factor P maturation arginine rhamnosyltransferase EarP [Shewanella gelidii]GGI88548.1 hypothetical protein GCM10009332_27450 [Shewanella gelidii]
MVLEKRSAHWDIFCAVVDNYGDIGVTWRLAKQLAAEYQIEVNLWVDDLFSFQHILPDLDPNLSLQRYVGVNIYQWKQPLEAKYRPGHVVIEAFACELPNEVKQSLNEQHQLAPSQVPIWLNLEYLSAESWVDGCHALPSLQSTGLKKHFYFPGFTQKSGGLICESSLIEQRESWQANPQNRFKLFDSLGLKGIETGHQVISLFSYENSVLLSLCQYLQQNSRPTHILVPKGRSLTSLQSLFPAPVEELAAGDRIQQGSLTIHILPMTDQQAYDQLLWSCDFNIVRGEDSFLRAQWAAKPFIWHIYPQDEDYHLVKLAAFLERYTEKLPPMLKVLIDALNTNFNQELTSETIRNWHELQDLTPLLLQHAQNWPNDALNGSDLAERLVHFVKNG